MVAGIPWLGSAEGRKDEQAPWGILGDGEGLGWNRVTGEDW